MKKSGLILVILIVIGTLFFVGKQALGTKKMKVKPVDVVFVGDKQYKPTFEQSVKSGKAFSDLFGAGLNSKKAGDYATAIKQFNECLPHASMGPEVAMVYEQLAEIYRLQGNLEKELFYIEEWPKYTMSDREKKECALRAAEIRQILSTQSQPSETK
jgi:tetratricopeptide (TPR) repeat protein